MTWAPEVRQGGKGSGAMPTGRPNLLGPMPTTQTSQAPVEEPAMPGMPPTSSLPLMSGGPPMQPREPSPGPAPVPTSANISMPDYQPFDPNTYHNPDLDVLSDYGSQLLDPGSDYYQQLLSQMRGDIGAQGAAAKRAAALAAAESGFGAGAGAARMAREGDIDYATQVGMGEGAGRLALAAPGMGASMMQSTFAPQMQEYGLTEQSAQYGHGAGEGARQFGVGVGLQEQGMANEMARFNASQYEQGRQFDDMFQLQQDELALQYGLDPYASGYGTGAWRGGGGLG